MSDSKLEKFLNVAKRGADFLIYFATHIFSFLRQNSGRTREQVKNLVSSTSDQVLEKAENTRKGVQLRMALLEMEHHLNRLYPQIGKMLCDLMADKVKNPTNNAEISEKIELAEEYRGRVAELKAKIAEHQQKSQTKKEDTDQP